MKVAFPMRDEPRFVQRPEDMSPDGYLRLIWQDDGDMIVVLRPADLEGLAPSVEFCASGGRSHRTLHALWDLFRAMQLDDEGLPDVAGRPDVPLAEFERRCRVQIGVLQEQVNPDNALLALLCDGVRLAREGAALAEDRRALAARGWIPVSDKWN